MALPTQSYRRSFAGSVGAGMKSIFSGNGRTYYMLVHKKTAVGHHEMGMAEFSVITAQRDGNRAEVHAHEGVTNVDGRIRLYRLCEYGGLHEFPCGCSHTAAGLGLGHRADLQIVM